jgi:ATP-binding cassette subfamily B protein
LITHRFTVAMRADLIYVIHEGRLVESGTHAELVAAGGLYAESWKAQMQVRDAQAIPVDEFVSTMGEAVLDHQTDRCIP